MQSLKVLLTYWKNSLRAFHDNKFIMKTRAVIFSRNSSTRLPGKALIDISGRCLLGRVINRTKEIKGMNIEDLLEGPTCHSGFERLN